MRVLLGLVSSTRTAFGSGKEMQIKAGRPHGEARGAHGVDVRVIGFGLTQGPSPRKNTGMSHAAQIKVARGRAQLWVG